MAQPVWITPAGNLGTIPEGVFYQTPLQAIEPAIPLTPISITSTGIEVALSFVTQPTIPYDVGTSIILSGFTPSSYNGTYTVLRASTSSVTFYNSTVAINSAVESIVTTGSTVTFNFRNPLLAAYDAGDTIFVSGFRPNAYNGIYSVVASTTQSVTVNNTTTTKVSGYGTVSNSVPGTVANVIDETVYYELISGQLPAGIQIQQTGLLVGIPKATINVQGVPEQVSRDVTSKFAVRAYTQTNRLSDRTFTLTISGQDSPTFVTPGGNIGEYFDNELVTDLQIQYSDQDPDDTVIVKLVAGQLPPGLTISTSGLISGLIQPIDETSVDYEFMLEVTDGKSNDLRSFSILVWNRNSMTADNTFITADNTFITADVSPEVVPIILNPQGSIGTVRSDNFYAYQFTAIDITGATIEFVASPSIPAPGLTLDRNSGWLYGYIPNIGITENTYSFVVRAYEKDHPTVISDSYNYSLTITGPISNEITWLTDSDLGTIINGSTSMLYVQAISAGGLELQYQLKSGSASSLPQGLSLLPSGEIAGRVSFDTFALDLGSTTFDVTKENGSDPTTFDLKFTFTVNVSSNNGVVDVDKEFTITVIRLYNEPYENLYIQAMPPQDDRDLVNSLLQNADIFQPEFIYRPQDLNFGIAKNIIYSHAYGLPSSTLDEYYSALDKNHYWKNLVLGGVKTAQARDAEGNVVYEVVYSPVIGGLTNNDGVSVGKEVVLPYPVTGADSTEISIVYPNSLVNMRDQVIDVIGQISVMLPQWMISKQSNGQILGFTPAWVLAYTKPGKSDQIAYYIREEFGEQLNLVDFEVDRYEVDRTLSKNWDPIYDSTVGSWIPNPPESTTFDIEAHYQLPEPNDSSFIFAGGFDYEVGDQILILGSQVGGEDEINDIVVTVTQVNSLGTIETAYAQGTAPLLTVGDIYTNIAGTNITGIGYSATWDIEIVGEDPTIFDGNSMQFISPVDMYTDTQTYDKYLVFRKRNILE